jgi:hypothetical protein
MRWSGWKTEGENFVPQYGQGSVGMVGSWNRIDVLILNSRSQDWKLVKIADLYIETSIEFLYRLPADVLSKPVPFDYPGNGSLCESYWQKRGYPLFRIDCLLDMRAISGSVRRFNTRYSRWWFSAGIPAGVPLFAVAGIGQVAGKVMTRIIDLKAGSACALDTPSRAVQPLAAVIPDFVPTQGPGIGGMSAISRIEKEAQK